MPDSSLSRRRFVSALGGAAAARTAPRRPRILLIMAGDMKCSGAGCYGGEIRTPNFGSLARGGIRSTQFYNAARFCPARASLLTGLCNHQAGAGSMVEDMGEPSRQSHRNECTLAEALREAGDHTRTPGKWRAGEKRPRWPLNRGSGCCAGPICRPGSSFRLTDLFPDWAVKHIAEASRRPQPCFLYVAHTASHWPSHALDEDIARYRGQYVKSWDVLRRERHGRQGKMGLAGKRWPLSPRVGRRDRSTGRIRSKLRETGGDNGGCSMHMDRGQKGVPPGPFLSYGLPWASASNTPLRLYKSTIHDGGMSTPPAPGGGPWELYDIEADRAECRNPASRDPGRLKQMIAARQEWANRRGAVPREQIREGGRKKKA